MKKEIKKTWNLQKRFSDIRSNGLIEVICPHGVGHHKGVHGCHLGKDGRPCCASCPPELWELVTKEE